MKLKQKLEKGEYGKRAVKGTKGIVLLGILTMSLLSQVVLSDELPISGYVRSQYEVGVQGVVIEYIITYIIHLIEDVEDTYIAYPMTDENGYWEDSGIIGAGDAEIIEARWKIYGVPHGYSFDSGDERVWDFPEENPEPPSTDFYIECLPCWCDPADNDHDCIEDELEREIAEKFSPVLHKHPLESQPDLADFDGILVGFNNQQHVLDAWGNELVRGPPLSSTPLEEFDDWSSSNSIEFTDCWYYCTYADGSILSGAYIDFDDSVRDMGASVDNRPLYYHVYKSGEYYYLQYWYFLTFNDLRPQTATWHEGDWEHVSIKLARDGDNFTPVKVNFYQHTMGHTFTAADCWWSPTRETSYEGIQQGYDENHTHLHIWLARNSHASYNRYEKVYDFYVDAFFVEEWFTDNVDYNSCCDSYFGYDFLRNLGEVHKAYETHVEPHCPEEGPCCRLFKGHFFHDGGDGDYDWLCYIGYMGDFWAVSVPIFGGNRTPSPCSPAMGDDHEWLLFSEGTGEDGLFGNPPHHGDVNWILDSITGDVVWKVGNVIPDCDINVLDAVRVVGIILHTPPYPTEYELWAADVNYDEVISIHDVICICNMILGRECGGFQSLYPDSAFVTLTKVPGNNDDYEVWLENSVEVAGVELYIGYNSTFNSLQKTPRSSVLDSAYNDTLNEVIVVLYGPNGEVIDTTDNGSILDLSFSADANPTITHAVLSTPEGANITWVLNHSPNTPGCPSPVDGATNQSINVDLSWCGGDPDGDPVTYDIYFDTTSPPPLKKSVHSSTTYDPGILQYGTRYYWQIWAIDNHGATKPGPIWDFTTCFVPNIPSNLSASGGCYKVDLTWDDVNNETRYVIERQLGANPFEIIATVGANVNSYSDTCDLTPGFVYWYRVKAFNDCGNSDYSMLDSGIPKGIPPSPDSLTAIPECSSVSLAWTDTSSLETGFEIQRKIGADPFAAIDSVGANVTSYTDAGLNLNTTYWYKVGAYSDCGFWGYSPEVGATTLNLPDAPCCLSVSEDTCGEYDLVWTDGSNNEAGFEIWRKDGFDGTYSPVDSVGENDTTYRDSGLGANVTYYYQVRAYNGCGNSGYSVEDSVETSGSRGDVNADCGVDILDAVLTVNIILDILDPTPYQYWAADAKENGSVDILDVIRIINIILYGPGGSSGGSGGDGSPPAPPPPPAEIALSRITGTSNYEVMLDSSTGVVGVEVHVSYNSSQMTPGTPQTTSRGASLTLSSNILSDEIIVVLYSTDLAEIGPGWGSIIYLPFQAAATHKPCITTAILSDASSEAITSTVDNAPAPPSDVAASPSGCTQIYLTWTDNANTEDGFLIERRPSGGGSYTQVATVGEDATSYIDVGLSPGSSYYYRLRAFNNCGSSDYSAEALGATLGPPVPPGNLTATGGCYQVSLTWADSSSDENGFKIERKTGAGGTYSQIATVGTNVTSYTNTGLSGLTTYYYRARAYNSCGSSAYCQEKYATTLAKPGNPTNLSASSGCSKITLSWSNVANESGYKIYRSTGGSYSQIATVGTDVTTYTNTGLSSSYTYYYKVLAYNRCGNSGYSNVASATPLGTPSAPSNCAASPRCGKITLSWSNVANESGYKIYRSTGGSYSLVKTAGSNVTSWTNTGLSSSYTYYYKVRAYNSCGSSGYSNTASAIPVSTPPIPTMLSATAVSSSQINISWTNVSGETGYKIYRNGAHIASPGANVTSYSNTGLSGGATYCYKVRARNGSCTSGYSNQKCATTESGGGGGSGCPFLYTWDGQEWVEDNNIMPASEDTSRAELDVIDYCKLEQPLVPQDSQYVIQIREFEREHTYLDSVALLTVDHSHQKELGLTPKGEMVFYKKEYEPISCEDSAGIDCLDLIIERDEVYFEGFAGDWLVLDFGRVNGAHHIHFKAISDLKAPPVSSIVVQVEDEGGWQEVGRIHPRANWAVDLMDLSGYLQGNEKDVRLRLYWTAHHKIDYAGLVREIPAQTHAQPCSLISAVHSDSGLVKDQLLFADGWYAELVPQDTLTVSFSYEPLVGNRARDFILVARGHYVIGDTRSGPLPKVLSIVKPQVPSEFFLSQNYPNPFNPTTTIRYAIPSREQRGESGEQRAESEEVGGRNLGLGALPTTLKIYNILGQEVRTVVDEPKEAGYYSVIWDGKDYQGEDVSSGLYLYRLRAGDFVVTKRMVLIR